MESEEGEEQVYIPMPSAYVDKKDGYVYTEDPEAIVIGDDGIYTLTGSEPLPSFPEIGYEFVNPFVAILGTVEIVGGSTSVIDGKTYVIYDPEEQSFTTNLI
jgi:hypothetical protein